MDSRTRFFVLPFHASRSGKRTTSMETLPQSIDLRTRRGAPREGLARIRAQERAEEKMLPPRERFCCEAASIGVKGDVRTRCPLPELPSGRAGIKTSAFRNRKDTDIGNTGNTPSSRPFGHAPKPARPASTSPSQAILRASRGNGGGGVRFLF